MNKYTVEIKQSIEVELDKTKFTKQFMRDFERSFYSFDSIEDHAKHLAQIYARGFADWPDSFVEGYGKINEMGIKFNLISQDEEIIKPTGEVEQSD